MNIASERDPSSLGLAAKVCQSVQQELNAAETNDAQSE
jgi:hypothetical protein